ncbi:MAG: hypothetical protein VX254_00755, partial [Planctomycetota bacterium]|nr:hypothetical protein [Planctomycetota bacterium]
MCPSPYPYSAILLCLLLFAGGCRHREETPPLELEPAGIEVRVRLFSAPRVFFRMEGAVEVRSIGDGRVLYAGEPGTLEAVCEGPLVRIAGRVFD